jgi:crotonobetainyl-CoA:carnitine CoA-transferase CaiB-like acyl-CoA transferase
MGRTVSELGPTPAIGYAPAPTKDGRWLQWANWAPHLNRQQLQLLGLDDVLDQPAYANLSALAPADAHALWERILVATAERTAEEWMTVLAATGAAGGDIMRTTLEGMDHPQIRFNGDVATIDDPALGPVEQLGPIADMAGDVLVVGPRSWVEAGAVAAAPHQADDGDTAAAPLAGLVLLEAASMIATPIGSAILADLGVRVIKIEPIGGEPGRTLPFIKTLQGKESIAVDIKAAEGREIVHRLAAHADMFLHNYRPGVPEKLGIDDASLRAHNPRLVYLYVGGYGKHGPCEKMPAYHPIAGAVCGNAIQQAGRGAADHVPTDMSELKAASLHLFRANEGHPDPVTGALAATALLVGIAARDRRGAGAEMTTSMLCASAHLFSGEWIDYAGRPPITEVDAELLGTTALDRLYETSDGWLFLGIDSTDGYQRFVSAIDQHRGATSVLGESRFASVADRAANDVALTSTLEELFRTDTADEWERILLAAGVGGVRADRGSFIAFQQAEIAADRHALARRVTSPGRGEHWRASAVVDMRNVDEVGGACLAGQHSRTILAELGYTPAEIDSLFERGIVGEPDASSARPTD